MTIKPANAWSAFRKMLLAICLVAAVGATNVRAGELPLAAGSPLVGFSFEDRPLMLPVQRNFQMAMLTASSEIGRSCGKMESYGWRMAQSEQQRVDQVFNGVINRLRGLGYVIEAQTPPSVSSDITMFTADRADRHFLFMSSAGEIGLVMVLCEASPTLVKTTLTPPSVQVFTQDVMKSGLNKNLTDAEVKQRTEKFSPAGNWVGSYTCAQGYTGATLQITGMRGENFDGVFRFYPTAKNPYALKGSYAVYGQYDKDSKRILINPGKWLERPAGFTPAVMVGGFDPLTRSFSGYFQGVNGCTSFEAKAPADAYPVNNGLHNTQKKQIKKPSKPKAAAQKKTAATTAKKDEKAAKAEKVQEPTPSKAEPNMETVLKPGEEITLDPAMAHDPMMQESLPIEKATENKVQTDVALPVNAGDVPANPAAPANVPPAVNVAPTAPETGGDATKKQQTEAAVTPEAKPAVEPAVTPAAKDVAPADRHGAAIMPLPAVGAPAPAAPTPIVPAAVVAVPSPAPTPVTTPAQTGIVPMPEKPVDAAVVTDKAASDATATPVPPTPPDTPTNIVLPSVSEPSGAASKK